MSDRDEGEVSRIRQEIIDNARTNTAIRERERRIKAKRERQAETPAPPRKQAVKVMPQPNPETYQLSPFHFVVPPLMVKLVIFNAVAWALIMLVRGEFRAGVGALVAAPVLILWMFVQWIVVYLVSKFYWWISGCIWLMISMATVLVLIAVITGQDVGNFLR